MFYRCNCNINDGKEITITLEDALMSLESLRFMMGGAIHHGASDDDVITVRHTEEVVCGAKGVVPKPKDHLTDVEYNITASTNAPVQVINLTTGVRTQLTSGTIDGAKVIKFKNPEMGVNTEVATVQGDRLRIFWTETFNTAAQADAAVEVTISPETYPKKSGAIFIDGKSLLIDLEGPSGRQGASVMAA